jgi:hypothetical protein
MQQIRNKQMREESFFDQFRHEYQQVKKKDKIYIFFSPEQILRGKK